MLVLTFVTVGKSIAVTEAHFENSIKEDTWKNKYDVLWELSKFKQIDIKSHGSQQRKGFGFGWSGEMGATF